MTARKRHCRIPVFIPHLGCPHQCVFCNQRSISGQHSFDEAAVPAQIEAALATMPAECDCQIAFFGGSFTGIDRGLMCRLLEVATGFVKRGRVSSIRLSTRPDLIDAEVLELLSRYPVQTIELGIQSTNEAVLAASGRGHGAGASALACHAVRSAGFELVGQMMIGLPSSDAESEIQTARDIVAFGASAARIYPTVVFANTPLAELTEQGLYIPLTVAQAVERAADVYTCLEEGSVSCLRIGLCASEELTDPACAIAGPNHPALGELVLGEVRYRALARAIEQEGLSGKPIEVFVPPRQLSQAVGQGRRNLLRLRAVYGIPAITVRAVQELPKFIVRLAKNHGEGERVSCI